MNTLIVYNCTNEVPEFYSVPPSSEAANLARRIAGKVVNRDKLTKREDAAFEELSAWFITRSGKEAKQDSSKFVGRFGEVLCLTFWN